MHLTDLEMSHTEGNKISKGGANYEKTDFNFRTYYNNYFLHSPIVANVIINDLKGDDAFSLIGIDDHGYEPEDIRVRPRTMRSAVLFQEQYEKVEQSNGI